MPPTYTLLPSSSLVGSVAVLSEFTFSPSAWAGMPARATRARAGISAPSSSFSRIVVPPSVLRAPAVACYGWRTPSPSRRQRLSRAVHAPPPQGEVQRASGRDAAARASGGAACRLDSADAHPYRSGHARFLAGLRLPPARAARP